MSQPSKVDDATVERAVEAVEGSGELLAAKGGIAQLNVMGVYVGKIQKDSDFRLISFSICNDNVETNVHVLRIYGERWQIL